MLSLIFIIAFPFVIWAAWKNIKMAEASTSWPHVNGTVTAADRAKVMFRTQPRVTYSYSVNNVPYTSKRISFVGGVPSKETDSVLARYPVGENVVVHYAPGDPAQAALEPGSSPAVVKPFRSLIILFVMLILANFGRLAVAKLEPDKPKPRTYGDGVAADPKLGDRLIREGAERGNPQDQFYVGTWYVMGHDVAKDPAQAANWWRKSADQGYADAQVFLGELHATGNGVEKNVDEALSLFRKASAQNNMRAYIDLGYSYEKGFGVPQDSKQAADWYRKAGNDPRATAGLKRLAGAK